MRTKLKALIAIVTTALAEGTKSSILAAGNAMAEWSDAKKFNTNEARDSRGRWTTMGGVPSYAYDDEKKAWVDEKGKQLPKKLQDRLESVPDLHHGLIGVRLNPDPKGALMAVAFPFNRETGVAGKMKWLYSNEHKCAEYKAKFKALKNFGKAKEVLAKKSYEDAMEGNPAAAAVLIMDRTAMRIGNSVSASKTKPTFGVTTLEARHVKVRGNVVTFKFQAKGDHPYEKEFRNGELASVVRSMLQAKDGTDKKPHDRLIPCTDDTVRTYMASNGGKHYDRESMGPHFYRYWWATAIAAGVVKKSAKPLAKKDAARIKRMACEAASSLLNNQPAMAYESYICPAVWKEWGEDVKPAAPKLSRELKAAGFDYTRVLTPTKASEIMDELFEETVFPEDLDISDIDMTSLFPEEEDMESTGEYDKLGD